MSFFPFFNFVLAGPLLIGVFIVKAERANLEKIKVYLPFYKLHLLISIITHYRLCIFAIPPSKR